MNGWRWKPSLNAHFKGKPSDAVLLFCCFLFGVVFWMYVAGLEPDTDTSRTLTREVTAPIHAIPGRIPVQDINVKTVSVTLQGPSSSMDHAPAARAYVDLAGFSTPGAHSVPIRVQTADADVTVTSVMPEKAQVFLDENETRTLHVAWHGINQPPAGYVSASPIIDPDTVNVTGPSTLIGKARASVDFDLANETDSTYLQLDVHLTGIPAAYSHLFTVKPPKIHAFVPIRRMMLFTTIPVEPQFVNIASTFVRADVIPPVVTVSGPRDVIDNLTRAPTTEINMMGATHSFSRRVALDLPDNVHVEDDSSVLVHVEIAPPAPVSPSPVVPTTPYDAPPPVRPVNPAREGHAARPSDAEKPSPGARAPAGARPAQFGGAHSSAAMVPAAVSPVSERE